MQMSNPANRLPPEYDEMQPQDYDPQFTADISTKMRVPDRIAPTEDHERDGAISQEALYHSDLHRTANMNIPDKIIMLGQDQSAGMTAPPDLHLDFASFPSHHQHVGLSTPPRVLTLDDRPFPSIGDTEPAATEDHRLDDTSFLTADDKDKSLQMMNGYIQKTPPRRPHDDGLRLQALQATPGDHLLISDDADDDTAVMRRQIAKLSRHVLALEDDNAKRAQREMVLYPVVLGYILFQVAKWFLSSK